MEAKLGLVSAASQLLALFNRSIRKISSVLKSILEGGIAADLDLVEKTKDAKQRTSLPSLGEELSQGAEEVEKKQKGFKRSKRVAYNFTLQMTKHTGYKQEISSHNDDVTVHDKLCSVSQNVNALNV